MFVNETFGETYFENRHFAIEKTLTNITKCTVDDFKFTSNDFLQEIPEQPQTQNLEPEVIDQFSAKVSNSLVNQVMRMTIYGRR